MDSSSPAFRLIAFSAVRSGREPRGALDGAAYRHGGAREARNILAINVAVSVIVDAVAAFLVGRFAQAEGDGRIDETMVVFAIDKAISVVVHAIRAARRR